MKLLYPLLSIILLSTQACQAQNNYNFGEGVIQIDHYFSPSLNLEHPDTANKLFATYTYYVKGSKVLRSEDNKLREFVKSKSSTTKENISFQTAFKASMVQFPYLLDFTENKSYVFYSRGDTAMASASSIPTQKLDIFYRYLLLPVRQNNQIVQNSLKPDSRQPGIGSGYGLINGDTTYFQYSTKEYSIPSPLGNFFSSQPLPCITLLWSPTPSTGADGKIIKAYSLFHIKKILPMNLPDSLFTIKPSTIIKENAPLKDMLPQYNQ